MALNDVTVVSPGGAMLPGAINFPVQSGATAILAGEPVKLVAPYAVPTADAEPVSTTPTFIGIASSNSNPKDSAPFSTTQLAAGTVDVVVPGPGVIFQAKAKDPTAVDTDAKILALIGSLVLFDLTAGKYTVDTAVHGATEGLVIVGGDSVNGTVTFVIRQTVQFSN